MKFFSGLSGTCSVSNVNSICRTCLCSLYTIDELFKGECMDCREYKSPENHRKSTILRDSIKSGRLTGAKIEDSINFITSLFSKIKKKAYENSENLQSVLYSSMFEKVDEANKLKNLVNLEMIRLRKSAENQSHLINIPIDNAVGIILNKLLNNEKIGQSGVINYRMDSDKILAKINQSSAITPYKIEGFICEPEIKYFISKPEFKLKKFKIYSTTFEDVPILNAKEFEWPEKGIFIEYKENLFLYSGRIGFFFF